MKKINILIATLMLSIFSITTFASHYVSGYSRSNGTYVQGHMSQDPYEARSSGYSYHNNQLEPNEYY